MVYYATKKNNYLMHHGVDGQHWGIKHGPPYPIDRSKKVTIKSVAGKAKQFLYDRFSEYGKDHQAVREKKIAKYMRKGYNETASQILAEQEYQRQDKALATAFALGLSAVTLGPLSVMLATKAVTEVGGIAAVKAAIGSKIAKSLGDVMASTTMKDVMTVAASSAVKSALR